MTQEWYTVREAAEELGGHPNTIRKYAKDGTLPGCKRDGVGGKTSPFLIPKSAVEEYQRTHGNQKNEVK